MISAMTFDIVNFPFLDGDVPRRASYGVYISQLVKSANSGSRCACARSCRSLCSGTYFGLNSKFSHPPHT